MRMLLDTLACSLLIRGWLSTLSEPWIRELPPDATKLVEWEGKRSAEALPRELLMCQSENLAWFTFIDLLLLGLKDPTVTTGNMEAAWRMGERTEEICFLKNSHILLIHQHPWSLKDSSHLTLFKARVLDWGHYLRRGGAILVKITLLCTISLKMLWSLAWSVSMWNVISVCVF